MKKAAVVLPIAAGAAALLFLVVVLRKPEPVSAPAAPPPPSVKPPVLPLPASPSPGGTVIVPPKATYGDPLLRRWQAAIRQRQSAEVLEVQAAFLAKENEYREPLMTLALEEQEPRIRAFSVAVLGRMKVPPPETFFLGRLGDAEEYPRTSACQALERIGTKAGLEALDRAAAGDSAAAVRAAASTAAKAVRSRGQ